MLGEALSAYSCGGSRGIGEGNPAAPHSRFTSLAEGTESTCQQAHPRWAGKRSFSELRAGLPGGRRQITNMLA